MKSTEENEYISKILARIPAKFQKEIEIAWSAISENYPVNLHSMPEPLWKKNNYEENGEDVWNTLNSLVSKQNVQNQISIYVHIPFCKDKKCGFCDCISVPLLKNSPLDKFIEALLKEIRQWSSIPGLAQMPVTVLYFGGGTPTSLPEQEFEKIIVALKSCFNINEETQISVECPGKLLSPQKLDFLKSVEIDRISIGVQTLENDVRKRIGRNLSTQEILEVIKNCKQKGFITCADIIYGLPTQTIEGYVDTIQKLIDAEIDGVSLYRFNITPRNIKFIENNFYDFQKDELLNFILLHIGHIMLTEAGYSKNHFVHYVKKDKNLYYTHLLRNEDLIAIGPTADGIIENYRYRHPMLNRYILNQSQDSPAFEGGVFEEKAKTVTKNAIVQLMCGKIEKDIFNKLGEKLTEKWKFSKLIQEDKNGSLELTANGSWIISQMIKEIANIN